MVIFKNIFFDSLRNSYSESQVFNLSFDRNVTRLAEYFITVNLCKDLYKWNSENKHIYKIQAEKSTSGLFRNCFDIYCYPDNPDIFSQAVFSRSTAEYSDSLKKIRNGRVDIALTTSKNGYDDIAEHIIEVKGINPRISDLKRDFDRIQCYLNAEIPSFKNSFKSGYIVFIKHINHIKKIHSKSALDSLKSKYLNNVLEMCAIFCNPQNTFEIFDQSIDTADFESIHKSEGDDYNQLAYETFTAFSVIIKICRNYETDNKI